MAKYWITISPSGHTAPNHNRDMFLHWNLHLHFLPVWPEKNCQMSIKVAQKWFHLINDRFWDFFKNCVRMSNIWPNLLLPKESPKMAQSGHTASCTMFLHSLTAFANENVIDLATNNRIRICLKTRVHFGREPWSSGYGWRLMFERSWVRIPALYTGRTYFHINLL